MKHGRVVRGLVVLTMLTALVGACGDDDDAATTIEEDGGDDGGTAADALEITGVDYAYSSAPESLTAGLVELTFNNDGTVPHEAAFIEIGDTPLEQFITDFGPVLEGGPIPAYAEQISAPAEIEAGESLDMTFTIPEGTYAMICTLDGDKDAPPPAEGEEPAAGAPHFTIGMAQVMEVGPAGDETELPDADGSITSSDYTFEADVEAGDTTINFVNDGPNEIHFAAIQMFPEGVDAAAAEAAFDALINGDPAAPPSEAAGPALGAEDVGFSGVFSTGNGAQFTLPGGFQSGRTYLAACFISDRAGGPPHAIGQKMYKAWTVE